MKKDSRDLLFEIGTEELPATNLADIFESGTENPVRQKFLKILETARLTAASVSVWVTARRLVFLAESLSARQSELKTFIRVGSQADSFDAAGKPTQKLLTILKHRGASVEETVVQDYQGKPFVFIQKTEASLPAEKVIPAMFHDLLKSLNFPKNMKWGERWEDGADIYFPRPIRNLLAVYGDRALSFKVGTIRLQPSTRIFSKAARRVAPVRSTAAYFAALKKAGIILNPAERKQKILSMLEARAKQLKSRLYDDPFLLNEVNYLAEVPFVLSAPFKKDFLKLPLEVLTVSMARKQRLFGLVNAGGQVEARFLAVLDGAATGSEAAAISRNMENILHAKLHDSLFFFQEDTKVKLERKRQELKDLVFLKGAGSMLEKSDRLVKLGRWVARDVRLADAEDRALQRAAYLCKADLLTQMIGEFPELQGIMGKHYALQNGEPADVAQAIGEQYLPRTVTDRLPESRVGALLSVMDKADLLTACFGLGLEPSSSADPYGLRRSATAILKILIDLKLDVSLSGLLEAGRTELGGYVLKDKAEGLTRRLEIFFKDRFKALLMDRGYDAMLIDSVLATDFSKPYQSLRRLEKLSGLTRQTSFQQSCKAIERLANILKGNKDSLPEKPVETVFTEELEKRLFGRLREYESRVREAIYREDLAQATNLYAEAFFDILNEFFEKVFVNAEDQNVRKNRLSLLRNVKDLYTREIADLSKVRIISA